MEIIDEIIKLKNSGMKNDAIAIKLNIPVGTVKSKLFRYKNKNGNKNEDKIINEVSLGQHCRTCGKEIKVVVGKKAKQFCSDYCRVKYWRKHKNDQRRV